MSTPSTQPRSSRLISRRAVRRVLLALLLGVLVYVVAALLQFEPDLVAVVLLPALVLAAAAMLRESVNPVGLPWYPPTTSDPLTRNRDGATFADLRLLESHQTARHPDQHLRRRLAVLADRALQGTHGVGLDTDEGRARLGPDVWGLVAGEPDRRNRRLSPRDIDLCLRTIEEL